MYKEYISIIINMITGDYSYDDKNNFYYMEVL